MNWRQFAVQLFEDEDADPGYMMLARADIPEEQKIRFLVAWVTYYNPGIAACASIAGSSKRFWEYLFLQYPTAKRASERRHFRGAAGRLALTNWRVQFPNPEEMVAYLFSDTYFQVRGKAKHVPQIGAYFVWKFADIQERVFRIPCDFTGAESYSPKVPQIGAWMIKSEEKFWQEGCLTVAPIYKMIYDHLNKRQMRSPPWYDRPMNMQEAETVCCVYHQYLGGKYTRHSRTAKAVRRLLGNTCSATDTYLEALLRGPTSHDVDRPVFSNRKEAGQWSDQILGDA